MKNLHGCGCDCSVQPCFERLKVLKNAEKLFMQLFLTIPDKLVQRVLELEHQFAILPKTGTKLVLRTSSLDP